MLAGLSAVNVELTSRCNKECMMCGRRKLEQMQKTDWGDMDFDLVQFIANQLPSGIVVQLHNNGEPTLYPRLGAAIQLFHKQVTSLNTNAILLMEKADEIIGHLDTLVVSVVEGDKTCLAQYNIVRDFIERKGNKKPLMVFRCLGDVREDLMIRYRQLGIVATRILHSAHGSFDYEKPVTVPEIGVCLDLLHHMSIDRKGKVSICVRFDPHGLNVIGDANKKGLEKIWTSSERLEIIASHLRGDRDIGLCATCDFWGVPTGRQS